MKRIILASFLTFVLIGCKDHTTQPTQADQSVWYPTTQTVWQRQLVNIYSSTGWQSDNNLIPIDSGFVIKPFSDSIYQYPMAVFFRMQDTMPIVMTNRQATHAKLKYNMQFTPQQNPGNSYYQLTFDLPTDSARYASGNSPWSYIHATLVGYVISDPIDVEFIIPNVTAQNGIVQIPNFRFEFCCQNYTGNISVTNLQIEVY
jgi:hypothetical protein